MSINSVTSGVQTQNWIQRSMAAADLDKNGQLSNEEFASFFTKLLDGLSGNTPTGSAVGSGSTPAATTAPTAAIVNSLAASSSSASFAPIPGFDTAKLTDTSYVNAKYTPAVRVFSQGLSELGLDAKTSRGNLGPMVDYAKQHGFPNAQSVSDDQIDFGDSNGPVDVITEGGTWWFHNLP
jgi:hypothetical protein